jgi:hypothetical protein
VRAARCLRALLLPALGALTFLHAPVPIRAQSLDRLGPAAGPWRAALIVARIGEAEITIDADDERLYANPRYRLPFRDLLRADPWRAGTIARSLTDQLLADASDPTDVLFQAESRIGFPVGNALQGNELAAARARVRACGDSSLAVALSELDGRPLGEFLRAGDYRLIPPVARDAAALMLFQIAQALRDRDRGLIQPLRRAGLEPQAAWQLARAAAEWHPAELPAPAGNRAKRAADGPAAIAELTRVAQTESMLDAVDFASLYRGANRIAAGAKQAIADLRAAADRTPPRDFRYAVSTRYGWVMVLGIGQHHHREDERHLFILDLGGDDVYANAGNTLDAGNPVSVVIDLAGNDEYRAEPTDQPAFGAGIGGYGMLFDLAGNDVYSCSTAGEGCGLLGVGLLYDAAGDDRYQGESAVQGCGVFGIGALVDLAGSDAYEACRAAQGHGYTLGAGLLVDVIGDDQYLASDASGRYPVGNGHGASLAQGFGAGRCAETTDGHAWAGGVGILVDGAGLDRYGCDAYGLGGAYGGGIGICADKMGDDDYTTSSAALGSAFAGGVAIAQDDGGNDVYRSGGSGACGYARDFGVASFEDVAGNDRYFANEHALGVGDGNGLGLCWDQGGNDIYVACNASFGVCVMDDPGTVRGLMLDAGFFVDGAGTDRYYQLPPGEREAFPFNFRAFGAFERFEGMADGTQLSRYDLLRHPGSTGAAVDVE